MPEIGRLLRPLVLITLAAAVAGLQGCATQQNVPLSADSRNSLMQAPIIHVVYSQSPAMNIMTPATVGGAGLIASLTGSNELPSGGELERAYGLPNPAAEVSTKLVQRLQAEGRLTHLRVEPELPKLPAELDAASYRGQYPDGLVLEITVPYHGGAYGVVSWKTYHYGVLAKARLIRPADASILWSDMCASNSQTDAYRLDISEFEANNGARLAQLFHQADAECAQVLGDKLLGKAQ